MITVETIQSWNYVLGILGIVAVGATALLAYDMYSKKALAEMVRKFGVHIALIATVASSAITLVYSEVFGVIPCGLCWLERILLYPQILLLGTALYFKDKLAPRYGIVLSAFGLVISLYHHYIQMGGSQFVKCPAAGAADCAKRFFFEFGFLTFPLMGAIFFAFLIVLYLYMLKVREG